MSSAEIRTALGDSTPTVQSSPDLGAVDDWADQEAALGAFLDTNRGRGKMGFESHHSGDVLETTVPAVAQAVTQDQSIGRSPIDGYVTGIALISEAAVTAHATVNRTIRIINKGQNGAGTTVVASLALDTPGADNLVAFDEKEIPLSATKADTKVAKGDILVVDEIVAGGGLAHSGYKLQVQLTA